MTEPKKITRSVDLVRRLKKGETLRTGYTYNMKAYFDNGDYASHLLIKNLHDSDKITIDRNGNIMLTEDVEWLKERLANSELDIYSAVVMARRDINEGNIHTGIARLKADNDKIRTFDRDLSEFIMKQGST